MNELKSSINQIQYNLFAPAYDLVKAWVEEAETLDGEIIKKLEASSLAQQEKQAYLQAKVSEEKDRIEDIVNALFATETTTNLPQQTSTIPDVIKNLIQQRSEAANHPFDKLPKEGQILLLGKGNGSSDDLELAIASPLTLILNKASTDRNIWDGWLVAKETDYATDWDLLLNLNDDAPLDPLAGMVQIWNPVKIYLPLIEKTIGTLKPARLTELRTLATEYKKSIAMTGKTSNTSSVIQQYQKMYRKVAIFIDKKAVIIKSPFEIWKITLFSQAKQLGQLFTPVPVVNYAMGSETEDDQEKNWLLDNNFLFGFNKQTIVDDNNPEENSFTIEYKENGFLVHHAILSKQSTKTEFICDPDHCDTENPTELIIKDSEGNELHRLNLSPDTIIKS